jgi:Raf kinase inhibitor-like YbhB/YbcL family protein
MIVRRNDFVAALAACVMVTVAGCGNADRNLASNSELSGGLWSISVTSPAFRDGQAIPKKYTADGENVSPPLQWSRGPSGTTRYVLMVEDPDAGRKTPAMHWLVYHIPVGTNELPENAAATGNLRQGKNYKGMIGYAGPNPPKGNVHHYHFQVFAIDQTAEIPPGATREELEKAALRGAIAKGEMIGTYGR